MRQNKKWIIIYVFLPILLCLILESFNRKSIPEAFRYMVMEPEFFLVNVLIILMTLLPSLFVKRRMFWLSLLSALWLVSGIMNLILLSNRATPFNATDFLLIKPGLLIMQKYFSVLFIVLAGILLMSLGGLVVWIWRRAPKREGRVPYIRNLIITSVVTAVTVLVIAIESGVGILPGRFDNLTDAYKSYGFSFCFTNSIFNMGIDKPEDYSAPKIEEILESVENAEEPVEDVFYQMPNIIFVQLESFFDINRCADITMSENPVSNFTNLKQESESGLLSVPVVGAGTVNTEFEVLTGMNMDDFGPGEYPYNTVMHSTTCESIAYNLSENGWKTHAIHNNDGTFYQRHTVYPNLGFDTFTPIEYMQVKEFTPNRWAKDKILTEEIMKSMKTSREKDFVFAVSVEGHGSYPNHELPIESPVRISCPEGEGKHNATQYYIDRLYSVDQFIGELINQLESFEEGVVLVLYGDHFPSLGLSDKNLTDGTIYQTDYLIWNNMNIAFNTGDMEAYQLSSEILKKVGIDTGVINQYHQTYAGKEEYLNGLQNLEYDILYGNRMVYHGINPYAAKNMRFGNEKIEITNLQHTEDEKVQIVKGVYFTESSEVYINEEKYDTEYLDENTLKVTADRPKAGDIICVGQQGRDGVVLSFTEKFICP